MEKAPLARPFARLCLVAHMFFPALSPDSVDKPSAVMREPPPLAAAPATERSERVGEEAEERQSVHVLLTHRSHVFPLQHEALFNQPALMPTY